MRDPSDDMVIRTIALFAVVLSGDTGKMSAEQFDAALRSFESYIRTGRRE